MGKKLSKIVFRVRPEPGSRTYFIVHLYDTRIDLWRATSGSGEKKGYCACTQRVVRLRRGRPAWGSPKTPHHCGNICFARTALNSMVILHEAVHAGLWWALAEGVYGEDVRHTNRGEERLARVIEDLFYQMERRLALVEIASTIRAIPRVYTRKGKGKKS